MQAFELHNIAGEEKCIAGREVVNEVFLNGAQFPAPHFNLKHGGFDDRADIHAVLARHFRRRQFVIAVIIDMDPLILIVIVQCVATIAYESKSLVEIITGYVLIRPCRFNFPKKPVSIERTGTGRAENMLRQDIKAAFFGNNAVYFVIGDTGPGRETFKIFEAVCGNEQGFAWFV